MSKCLWKSFVDRNWGLVGYPIYPSVKYVFFLPQPTFGFRSSSRNETAGKRIQEADANKSVDSRALPSLSESSNPGPTSVTKSGPDECPDGFDQVWAAPSSLSERQRADLAVNIKTEIADSYVPWPGLHLQPPTDIPSGDGEGILCLSWVAVLCGRRSIKKAVTYLKNKLIQIFAHHFNF